MRTSAVIAAIGAAAVLGGVVGAGAMRGLLDNRVDALLDRVGALEAALDARRWWCDGRLCERDRSRCEQGGRTCSMQRVSFCALGPATPFCYETITACESAARGDATCIGVE